MMNRGMIVHNLASKKGGFWKVRSWSEKKGVHEYSPFRLLVTHELVHKYSVCGYRISRDEHVIYVVSLLARLASGGAQRNYFCFWLVCIGTTRWCMWLIQFCIYLYISDEEIIGSSPVERRGGVASININNPRARRGDLVSHAFLRQFGPLKPRLSAWWTLHNHRQVLRRELYGIHLVRSSWVFGYFFYFLILWFLVFFYFFGFLVFCVLFFVFFFVFCFLCFVFCVLFFVFFYYICIQRNLFGW